MPSFLQLPGWLPWWAFFAIVVPVALYGLLFLAMPFSVFGVKSRLEQIDSRIEDLQQEIRSLAIRLAEPPVAQRDPTRLRPPPPAAAEPDLPRLQPPLIPVRAAAAMRPPRAEPRLDWPS